MFLFFLWRVHLDLVEKRGKSIEDAANFNLVGTSGKKVRA